MIIKYSLQLVVLLSSVCIYASTTLSETHNYDMGFLFVNPNNKWGLPKSEALRLIRREANIALEVIGDSEERTWLLAKYFAIGINDRERSFVLRFRLGYDTNGLSNLKISYTSTDASISDIKLLYSTLIDHAQRLINAPETFRVIQLIEYQQPDSEIVTFGNIFWNGNEKYEMEWRHMDTLSSLAAYRMNVKGQMMAVVELAHFAKPTQ